MRRAKSFVKPLSPEALRRQLKKMVEEETLPSLEDAAVLESRQKYCLKILRAKREAERKVTVN
jgi:hypothetical protein